MFTFAAILKNSSPVQHFPGFIKPSQHVSKEKNFVYCQ